MAVLCTVQGCPVFSDIGPYLSILATDCKATIESIYRGADAERLLHKLGKHSQSELYAGWMERRPGFNPANPPGYSTHELHSDGAAYPNVGRGERLEWWMQGFDVNDADTDWMIDEARKHGWKLWRPYPGGSEHHHLNFRERPRPGRSVARIYRLRQTLPRS